MPEQVITAPEARLPATVGRTILSLVHSMRVGSPLCFCPFCRLVIRSRQRMGWQTSGKSSASSGLVSSQTMMFSSRSLARSALAAMRQTNGVAPVRADHTTAAWQRTVLPLPRGMAMANRPPVRTARSIFSTTRRWSGDQAK